VQDGLSTSVAMFINNFVVIVAMVVIMFTYSWKLTLIGLALITPSLFANRIFMYFFNDFNKKYQDAKGELGAMSQETFSNLRTVKAFADEKGAVDKYSRQNDKTFKIG
jgi:ABC-type bacteriocin/lantibiotic exporter with double-glycine peptidase domain